jgi:hypothetical protein
LKATAFVKALRKSTVRQFTEKDTMHALAIMGDSDPYGQRLWALMSQSKLPEAVDRWIWQAAQYRLRAVVGADFDPMHHDSSIVLHQLVESLAPRLASKQNIERKAAENWLRIGTSWLMEKRSLDAWTVAETLRPLFYRKGADAMRSGTRTIRYGRPAEFKQAVAISGLAHSIIEAASRERDAEKRSADAVRQELEEATLKMEEMISELSILRDELSAEKNQRLDTETQLENERQHWGHDLSEIKARHRTLLRTKVAPMLTDAVDALEIETPAPQIAINRLKAVIAMIKEEKNE